MIVPIQVPDNGFKSLMGVKKFRAKEAKQAQMRKKRGVTVDEFSLRILCVSSA